MRRSGLVFVCTVMLLCLVCSPAIAAEPARVEELAEALSQIDAPDLNSQLSKRLRDQTWRNLRALSDAANLRDVQQWRAVESRTDWERLRDQGLQALRQALGTIPEPSGPLEVHDSGQVSGDGFVVRNLVYRRQPGFWVTANLYLPAQEVDSMPGLILAHSHHRPKTQGELQDMGMTWARQGCAVLVIDQLGHGERADHPFQSERDYARKDESYRWWRQDYYYRYDVGAQLHLAGQSLMGWMVWDLMRGVDLLLSQPRIDSARIAILGAVAGGGDPAAITAALDRRIQVAVPFNFGGPQPETRFPLPEDAELHFNYLGGAYWEATRNLHRTGADGFFHWLIVGSIAPRGLIYAHEFAWDREHDPVWKRLNTIYGFYDARSRLDYTLGRGSVKGSPPESTHCTNIGRHHRQRIHEAFQRWLSIDVTPDDEFTARLEPEQLVSMTEPLEQKLQPQRIYERLQQETRYQLESMRRKRRSASSELDRNQIRAQWKSLLGRIETRQPPTVLTRSAQKLNAADDAAISVEHLVLETEADFAVRACLLLPARSVKAKRTVVAVAQSGHQTFLKHRARVVAELLEGGAAVCLVDVREAGTERGSHGGGGSLSVYALLFETPLVGYRLRDVRGVLRYLRTRDDLSGSSFVMWGDSFSLPNPAEREFQVPWRVSGRPRFSEPLGGMLAMLTALFEDDVAAVYVHGGLSQFHDVFRTYAVYVPHDVVIPGLLKVGDLPDLAEQLNSVPIRLDSLVDALNRPLAGGQVNHHYEFANQARTSAVVTDGRLNTAAAWMLESAAR